MGKESSSPLMYDVKPATNLSELNQAGIGEDEDITKQREKTLQANEDYASALEQRFRNPNWMKVSAALLKPQLGGFGASLGSAFDVLGEQQEQQKAVAPTIAQIRAQNAVGYESLQNDLKAQDLLREAMKKPGGLTSEDVANINKYSARVGPVAQQKFTNQQSLFSNRMEELKASTSKMEAYKNLPKDFVDQYYDTVHMAPGLDKSVQSGTTQPKTTDQSQTKGSETKPTVEFKNKPPIGFQGSADDWNQMTIAEQQKAREQVMTAMLGADREKLDKYSTNQEAAQRAMGIQKTLYELSGKPGMDKVLGLFEHGNIFGALGKAAESGTFPEVVTRLRDQMTAARATPEEMANFQVLIGLVAQNLNLIRQTQQNPSNYLTGIDEQAGPGAKDLQDAFRRKVALMLHDSQYHVDQYKNLVNARKKGMNIDDYLASPENEDFMAKHQGVHTQIGTNPAPLSVSELIKQFHPTAPTKTTPTASAPSNTSDSSILDELKKFKAQEEAKKNNP